MYQFLGWHSWCLDSRLFGTRRGSGPPGCRRGNQLRQRGHAGYHHHYRADGAELNRPVADDETGFVLAPMRRGIRLSSGAEFAGRDSRAPVQIEHALLRAREALPLGESVEPEAWRGARPPSGP